ncbi:MFS transporter [Alkalimarinus sediminis]|uniref:MFS transporter n=1 Tax=Alkalimarinus sediminis TaxID=1632866 RepID=A0A9E8HJB3_9ALTE|nr:MFS transporter [Alkalimarinus sediminis]UZW75429.1 MFS transporter [Alkalimarinus sediminis]
MNVSEKRSVFSLALLYAMRMLGLFMVLPVFVLLGDELNGSNGFLIGIAIGAYGLTQALLQVPFGMLSDRFGRKKMIIIGLLIFCLGSVVAAASESIYGVIVGRLLQGAGAIASVLMALLSDLTTEESRTKGMAVVGMSIGLSFSVALVAGPLVSSFFGLSGIFWLTAAFAIIGVAIVLFVVPTPVATHAHRDTRAVRGQFFELLKNPDLLRLDIGIFVLHLILTALFIAVPLSLVNDTQLDRQEHWWVYLSVMVTAFFAMVPFIIIGEKKRKIKAVFAGAILQLSIGSVLLVWANDSLTAMWGALFVFFMAFNLLEASLPSLVSKQAPAGARGTAMGIYSTSQFFGAFLGGVVGGWVLSNWGGEVIYYTSAALGGVWFLIALTMRTPSYSTSRTLKLNMVLTESEAVDVSDELFDIQGVEDVVIVIEEQAAYLKIDKAHLDEEALTSFRFALKA